MNLIIDFLVYFFNLPIFEMLLFGVRLMFLLLLLLVLTRTWRTVYHWHIRPSLKKWLSKGAKNEDTETIT